jgi:hypothetical protein
MTRSRLCLIVLLSIAIAACVGVLEYGRARAHEFCVCELVEEFGLDPHLADQLCTELLDRGLGAETPKARPLADCVRRCERDLPEWPCPVYCHDIYAAGQEADFSRFSDPPTSRPGNRQLFGLPPTERPARQKHDR